MTNADLSIHHSTRRGAQASQLGPFVVALAVFYGIFPAAARSDEATSFSTILEDTRLYFTSPVRWDREDWLYFGGVLVAVGASHQFDDKVRAHFAVGSHATLNGGQDNNSLRDAVPTVAIIVGTGLYAAFIRDTDGYQETWSLVEAAAFSTATAEVLSIAGGRERPDGSTSPNEWRHGGDSFPSAHSSAAWAVGSVFAESGNDEYRWVRRIIGYGVAAGTSYVRIKGNEHWLSDTVAGAALGIATARFVLNRQESRGNSALQFQPTYGGWLMSYSVRFH